MRRRWALLAFVLGVGALGAEPVELGPREALAKVKRQVAELVANGVGAEKLLAMAQETNNGAERFWFYGNAFILQAKAANWADAAETIRAFRDNVSDVPEVNYVSLVERYAMKGVAAHPPLAAFHRWAKTRVLAKRRIAELKAAVQAGPRDDEARLKLAEALAVVGNWEAAANVFSGTRGLEAAAVAVEREGRTTMKTAAFWWNYRPRPPFASSGVFKAHAAGLYAGLVKGERLSVVELAIARQRIERVEKQGAADEWGDPPSAADVGGTKRKDDAGGSREVDERERLKKLCDAKGLLHCWPFNGTTKDVVGGADADCHGDVVVGEKQVTIHGGNGPSAGNVHLGHNIIPNDGTPVTLELWATQNKVEWWSRVIAFGEFYGRNFELTWSVDWNNGRNWFGFHPEGADGVGSHEGKSLAPFHVGKEYHIGIVIAPRITSAIKSIERWEVRIYKQDAQTGKTLAKYVLPLKRGWSLKGFPMTFFHLGYEYFKRGGSSASASYNEVRVWNRALSEGELMMNAIRFRRMGETAVVEGKP